MMINLTNKQNEGLKIALNRYKQGEKYTCIAGYAGTGKSTLVQYIIKELNINSWEVEYCCYTGKAALVLSQKGCPAQTAHRLLYRSKELPDGTFIHKPRLYPENPDLKIVVVDEVSMLEKEMWAILMSWNVHVICLGDPEQLPPLHEHNGILDSPHIFLTEIVRQALDNEIIKLSMDIREGKYIPYVLNGKDVSIIPKSHVNESLLLNNIDQVICGKNVTRYNLNKFMRESIYGDKYQDLPLHNDKIICLKNYCEFGLVNGEIGNIINPKLHKGVKLIPNGYLSAGFTTDYSQYEKLKMDPNIYKGLESSITPQMRLKLDKCERPLEFDYGYAITCHKSQGSQWDNVAVFDEWLGDKDFHRRWLYTAVTRAVKNLIIFK